MWQFTHDAPAEPRLMKVVRRRVEVAGRAGERRQRGVGLRRVALQAHGVAGELELAGVRVVAVQAAHALLVHLALPERAVDIHLVELLAVGVVQALGQQAGQEVVEPRLARHVRGREFAAP